VSEGVDCVDALIVGVVLIIGTMSFGIDGGEDGAVVVVSSLAHCSKLVGNEGEAVAVVVGVGGGVADGVGDGFG
jgi:hypothetical protein